MTNTTTSASTPGTKPSANMMRIRLKYVSEDVDRHGNPRCYLRMPGRPKVRLRSMPGTPEFMLEYQEALSGTTATTIKPRSREAIQRGTFRYLCVQYFKSGEYSALDISTRNWQRRALERICQTHGANLVSHMQPRHVRILRDELLATPGAANGRLKALRALFNWANEAEETTVNPTLGVKRIKYPTDGHHTWTDAEIAQYQERHPVGTKARLAFDLLRYIAFRREDVVRLGPEHIRGGRVQYRQAKNEDRNPVDLDIPLQRRWILEHELVRLAETFQVSECDRVGLRLRQIRPVHSDGTGFSAQDMQSRRREANRLAQQERRRRDAEHLKERSAADAGHAKLSDRETLIYEKITAAWRSTAEIARSLRRTHGYEGTRDLASIGKAVNRASEKLVSLRLVERDPSRKGANGQPLNYFRRMIVHAENVFETSRQAENATKNQIADRL